MGGDVSAHFGHCAEYALVDIEGARWSVRCGCWRRRTSRAFYQLFLHRHGAGWRGRRGGMGPRAVELFEQLGIQVVMGVQGRWTMPSRRLRMERLPGARAPAGMRRPRASRHPDKCHE